MQKNMNKKFHKLIRHFKQSEKEVQIDHEIEDCQVRVYAERNIFFNSLGDETGILFELDYTASYKYDPGNRDCPPEHYYVGHSLDCRIEAVIYSGVNITKDLTKKQINALEELIYNEIETE